MRRALLLAATILLAVGFLPSLSSAGPLSTSAACEGDRIVVSWSWYEDPLYPTGDPEWTGYDVYRQGLSDCGEWARVNALPFPRTMGASESFSLTDTPPAGQACLYEVRLVRDDRTPAPLPAGLAWDLSWQRGYAACPETSVPIVRGQLSDELGWTLIVRPCDGTCYPQVYVMDYEGLLALQPYVGQTVQIYGTVSCGSIEGCSLDWMDHFDVTPCLSPTPAGRTSWGRLKSLYR